MADATSETASVVAQPVSAPLTRAAIFLVVTINPGEDSRATVRSFCADFAGLVSRRRVSRSRGRAFLRDGNRLRRLGIGCSGTPRPAELHPFSGVPGRSAPRHRDLLANLLFHIRAKRMDLCFEMAAQVMGKIGDAVTAVDEVHGFSLLRRPRPSGLRRRHGKSAWPGGRRRRADRR